MEIDTQKVQNVKTIVVYSTLGLGTATGLFFLGRHFYKKLRANKSEEKSLDEGSPATFAKQLNMAFKNDNYFGWGTNLDVVNTIFRHIPTKKMYEKVQKEYMRLYNKSLNADLENELTSDEYNGLIRILSKKQ